MSGLSIATFVSYTITCLVEDNKIGKKNDIGTGIDGFGLPGIASWSAVV